MNLIGYWMESLRDVDLPLPQELKGELPDSSRRKLCECLRAGNVFTTYRGHSWCRCRCGAGDVVMGCREFTDGQWVWPEGLVHYVESHGVVLPDAFLSRALSGTKPERFDEAVSPSLDLWIEWARGLRSSAVRQRLGELLVLAQVAQSKAIERKIDELQRNSPEGQELCVFANCGNRILAGMSICARHSLGKFELELLSADLFRLPEQIETGV